MEVGFDMPVATEEEKFSPEENMHGNWFGEGPPRGILNKYGLLKSSTRIIIWEDSHQVQLMSLVEIFVYKFREHKRNDPIPPTSH